MISRRIALFSLAFLAAPAAHAAEQYFDYKDWTVRVEAVDTGEDLRVTCSMWTGGDGEPTVGFTVSNGDALPPDIFPGVQLMERAIRGHATVLKNEEKVTFVFDDGDSAPATVYADFDEDGFAFAQTSFAFEDNQRVLQAHAAEWPDRHHRSRRPHLHGVPERLHRVLPQGRRTMRLSGHRRHRLSADRADRPQTPPLALPTRGGYQAVDTGRP